MRLGFRIAALWLALAGVLAAQYASVQNAASVPNTYPNLQSPSIAIAAFPFLNAELVSVAVAPGNTVAPGMLAVLSNDGGLGVPEMILSRGPNPASRTPKPNTSAAVSIRPWGSATASNVEVVSITDFSVSFVVPRNMPLGGAEVEYKIAEQPTAWTNVNVVPASFDFFRIVPGGPVIAQSVAANGAVSSIGMATPAQPGQTVLLAGSGLGNGTSFTLTVGGVPATIVSAQPHRATPGVDEIQFQMPAAVPDGCYVPLTLAYGNTTVTSTVSKSSNGGPCPHPFQLSPTDLQTLDNGGYIAVGEIDMNTNLEVATPTAASRDESADVYTEELYASDLASLFTPASTGCTAGSAPEFFAIYDGYFSLSTSQSPPDLGSVTLQNGTTTLAFNDTNDYLDFPPTTEGPLTNQPAPVIAGGNWTWGSAGNGDLAASSFVFPLPAPIQLNGTSLIMINHSQGQSFTWNGTAFDAGAILTATLDVGSTYITCTVPAGSGTLNVPSNLFGQFAGASIGSLNITVSETGSYIPHAHVKLQNGSTLPMFVNYSASEDLPVDIQ